jgi:hypothetical protein
MDAEQIYLARHALGLPNKRRVSYRNRYHAADDTPVWRMWVDMVSQGHAVSRKSEREMTEFSLTTSGARKALVRGERLCKEDFP